MVFKIPRELREEKKGGGKKRKEKKIYSPDGNNCILGKMGWGKKGKRECLTHTGARTDTHTQAFKCLVSKFPTNEGKISRQNLFNVIHDRLLYLTWLSWQSLVKITWTYMLMEQSFKPSSLQACKLYNTVWSRRSAACLLAYTHSYK